MNAATTKLILTPVLTFVLLMTSNSTFAQGTASGPTTFHNVTSSGGSSLVSIGPQGIDLDPDGPPWTKYIFDDAGFLNNDKGSLRISERIINIGNEPWYDWHEHVLPGPTGVLGVWDNAQLLVNGVPIGFNIAGVNTPDLWLDGFTQPVLPGDTLTINKTLVVRNYVWTPGAAVLRIEEYPTPEPASAALMGLGSMILLKRRKEAPLIS